MFPEQCGQYTSDKRRRIMEKNQNKLKNYQFVLNILSSSSTFAGFAYVNPVLSIISENEISVEDEKVFLLFTVVQQEVMTDFCQNLIILQTL